MKTQQPKSSKPSRAVHYPLLVEKVFLEPWYLEPRTHFAVQDVLLRKLRGEDVTIETVETDALTLIQGRLEGEDDEGPPIRIDRRNDLAIVHVRGIIGKRISWIEAMCGGCDIDWITTAMRALDADAGVRKIVLDFDSPGGTVTGLPEAADLIAEIAERKHVVAFSETKCLSAAYYLAAQAGDVFATPSAQVGSIGTLLAFLDERGRLEALGLTPHLYQAGKLKTAAHPWVEPSADVEGYLQGLVDRAKADFDAAVSGRGIPASAREGQVFSGEEAVEAKLVDELVRDREELLAFLEAAVIAD